MIQWPNLIAGPATEASCASRQRLRFIQPQLGVPALVQDLSEYSFVLGKREVIAGLEYGIQRMRVGGHRKFHAGPHLCYRDEGVADSITIA